MRRYTLLLTGAAALVLAGCNTTIDDRTLRRTATGAAIGAATAVVVSGSVIQGAAAGAVVGAVTSKDRTILD